MPPETSAAGRDVTDARGTGSKCDTPIAPGLRTVDVVQSGVNRPLQIWVPSSYSGKPVPLMFWLHGSGTTGAQAMSTRDSTGRQLFPADADEHGYVVAAPTGAIPFNPAPGISGFAWNIPGVPLVGSTVYPPASASDDVAYIGLAIDAIAATLCIDQSRIYASGASGGGRMASQLACDLSTRIAAIAPIMGVRFPQATDTPGRTVSCFAARRVPVLAIHGRLDPVNVFADDDPRIVPGSSWTYGVGEALRRWAAFNGCRADQPSRTRVSANVEYVSYGGCQSGADVALYDIANGGHTIPSTPSVPSLVPIVGPTNQELDTPDAIWTFVSSRRLPSGFTAVSTSRVFDTRAGLPDGAVAVPKTPIAAGNMLKVKVAGIAGVPASGVAAVSLNVTVANPTGAGFVTAFPCGDRPAASNLNYVSGQIVPNAVIAPVSPTGEVCFFTSATTDIIADINGWFES